MITRILPIDTIFPTDAVTYFPLTGRNGNDDGIIIIERPALAKLDCAFTQASLNAPVFRALAYREWMYGNNMSR